MKKLCLLLALVMTIASASLVSAATTVNGVTFDVSTDYDAANKTVTANYSIAGLNATKGFNNYTITLDYDKQALTPVSILDGNIKMKGFDALGKEFDIVATGDFNANNGKVVYCIYDDGNTSVTQLPQFTTDGVLFSIVYKVNDGAAATAKVGANIEIIDTVSSNNSIAGILAENINVSTDAALNDVMLGDVDGNGKVDRADLITLGKHFANLGVTINEKAADINGNGKVDRADLVLLAKYFAGDKSILTK
jgi:endoglucanase family 5; S-layer homology, cell-adhesion and dockerin domains